ncbi:MAG: antibiotic biosynthesis monooxygenase [Rhodobacterales bacterium]|nr:antibiotic biosynthesis monooxygenase [Rhodobacterales bacterium]
MSTDDGTDTGGGPVTVSIARKVRPGREADYEAWVKGITATASVFPGHLGVNVLRPSAATGHEYVIIYRFDSYAHCRAWDTSPERAHWVDRLGDMVEGEARTKRVTGLEFWFDLPEMPAAAAPSPHRMALTLMVVVFVLVVGLNLVLGGWMADLPMVARVAVTVVLQVLLMTYVVMPRVTRLLKGWLYVRR